MAESFGDSIVLNLRRQKVILESKIEQIDEIIELVDSTPEVAKFAELMQAYQSQPQQRPPE